MEQDCWSINFHAIMHRWDILLSSSGNENKRSIGLYRVIWNSCNIGVNAFLIFVQVARWSRVSRLRPQRRHIWEVWPPLVRAYKKGRAFQPGVSLPSRVAIASALSLSSSIMGPSHVDELIKATGLNIT